MKQTLPIRQNLDLLAGLNRTQRAVLTHVVELAEHGGRGHCNAKNDALGLRLQATTRTITRTLSELERLGLLLISGSTTRRQIVAAPQLRSCYASDTKEACMAATQALGNLLSIDKISIDTAPMPIDKPSVSIDKQGECLETSEAVSIDKQGRVYKEEEKEEKLKEKEALVQALRGALTEAEEELSEAQKKIAELEAQLQAERQASRTRGGGGLSAQQGGRWDYDPAAIAENLVLPFDTPEFREAWAAYRQFRHENKFAAFTGGMMEQEALRHLGTLAAGSQAEALEIIKYSIRGGYKTLCKQDVKRPSPQQHPGAPQRGAKPTGAGALGARAAAEHFAALDATRAGTGVYVLGNGPTAGADPLKGPA